MSIRLRHLDLETAALKPHVQTFIGDVTAITVKQVFIAPCHTVIERIDFYSNQAQGQISDSSIVNIRAELASNSDTLLVARGTSGSTLAGTNAISANARFSLTPSGNNSFTQGQGLILNICAINSAALSAVIVDVIHKPIVHGENR